jgi:RNA polymerase sigma factor (sigma-70 family)
VAPLYRGGMISDTQWAIRYMETGNIPGTKWNVARWSREKREVLFDPQVLDRCFIVPNAAPEVEEGIRAMLKHLLSGLSVREREAFVLIYGQRYSYQEAADFMGLSKGNVYNLIKRTEKKFSNYRNFVGRKQTKGEGVY